MGILECSIHCRHVPHGPEGLTALVDAAPRAFPSNAKRNEFSDDCTSTLPVLELDGAQPSPDVRVQTVKHSLDPDRADSEETEPPEQIGVEPCRCGKRKGGNRGNADGAIAAFRRSMPSAARVSTMGGNPPKTRLGSTP